jgi:hypothetical protein
MAKNGKSKPVALESMSRPGVVEEVDVADSLIGGKSGGEKKSVHVVHKGEQARKATEEESMSRQFSEPIDAIPEESIPDFVRATATKIKGLKASAKRFQGLSYVQRISLNAVLAFSQEILGERTEAGTEIKFSTFLGIDPKTGNSVGNSA